MDSLAGRGLTAPVTKLETKDDGQTVDVGDIEAIRGFVVRGKIVLSEGRRSRPAWASA